jgi:ribonuclease HI
MPVSDDKAKLLEQLAARTDLSDAERSVLLEAAKRFRGDARPRRPRDVTPSRSETPAPTAEPQAIEAVLSTDGGARGNPGPAGIGAHLITPSGKLIAEISEYLGETTNNVAEYRAVIAGLERAREHGVRRLTLRADSELVIKQLKGEYRVRDEKLIPLHNKARRLLAAFDHVELRHVRREYNAEADRLANEAMDRAG